MIMSIDNCVGESCLGLNCVHFTANILAQKWGSQRKTCIYDGTFVFLRPPRRAATTGQLSENCPACPIFCLIVWVLQYLASEFLCLQLNFLFRYRILWKKIYFPSFPIAMWTVSVYMELHTLSCGDRGRTQSVLVEYRIMSYWADNISFKVL